MSHPITIFQAMNLDAFRKTLEEVDGVGDATLVAIIKGAEAAAEAAQQKLVLIKQALLTGNEDQLPTKWWELFTYVDVSILAVANGGRANYIEKAKSEIHAAAQNWNETVLFWTLNSLLTEVVRESRVNAGADVRLLIENDKVGFPNPAVRLLEGAANASLDDLKSAPVHFAEALRVWNTTRVMARIQPVLEAVGLKADQLYLLTLAAQGREVTLPSTGQQMLSNQVAIPDRGRFSYWFGDEGKLSFPAQHVYRLVAFIYRNLTYIGGQELVWDVRKPAHDVLTAMQYPLDGLVDMGGKDPRLFVRLVINVVLDGIEDDEVDRVFELLCDHFTYHPELDGNRNPTPIFEDPFPGVTSEPVSMINGRLLIPVFAATETVLGLRDKWTTRVPMREVFQDQFGIGRLEDTVLDQGQLNWLSKMLLIAAGANQEQFDGLADKLAESIKSIAPPPIRRESVVQHSANSHVAMVGNTYLPSIYQAVIKALNLSEGTDVIPLRNAAWTVLGGPTVKDRGINQQVLEELAQALIDSVSPGGDLATVCEAIKEATIPEDVPA